MKKPLIAVAALGLTLALSACSPNGTTTTSEPAPSSASSSAAPTPTPTPTVHVAVEVDLKGDAVAWSDIVAVHERGDSPVLWLVPEAGATLTLVGSNVLDEVALDGGMGHVRNAEGDLVLSPKLSTFDGSVVGSGGEICAYDPTYFCFQVKAVQP